MNGYERARVASRQPTRGNAYGYCDRAVDAARQVSRCPLSWVGWKLSNKKPVGKHILAVGQSIGVRGQKAPPLGPSSQASSRARARRGTREDLLPSQFPVPRERPAMLQLSGSPLSLQKLAGGRCRGVRTLVWTRSLQTCDTKQPGRTLVVTNRSRT